MICGRRFGEEKTPVPQAEQRVLKLALMEKVSHRTKNLAGTARMRCYDLPFHFCNDVY